MKTYDLLNKLDAESYRVGLQEMFSNNLALQDHKSILEAHYNSQNHKATSRQIADLVGYKKYNVINHLYGKLGRIFCDTIGYTPELMPPHKSIWWAVWSIGYNTKEGFLWEMRPQVCKALEMLGWVQCQPVQEEIFRENQQDQIAQALKRSEVDRQNRIAQAPTKPQAVQVLRTEYQRDPDVIASTLLRAEGKCQLCNALAPFKRESDGSPYLEVHHIISISAGGEDTLRNAVALCPNCHRQIHHGIEKENLNKQIRYTIQRQRG